MAEFEYDHLCQFLSLFLILCVSPSLHLSSSYYDLSFILFEESTLLRPRLMLPLRPWLRSASRMPVRLSVCGYGKSYLCISFFLPLSLQHTHKGIHINGQFDYAILCLILRSWLKLSLSLYFFFSLSLDTLLKKSLSLISHKHTRQTHTNTIRPTLCLVLRPWLRSATKILLKVRILIYN